MKSTQSDERIKQLLAAATKVFISRGYRRATMADIAREMGVAPGTIYLYVESKEALFHLLAMRTAVDPASKTLELPVKTPPPSATLDMLRNAMSVDAYAPRLASMTRKRFTADAAAELPDVLGELYDSAFARRDGINLIERSAMDWPEMAEVFFRGLRSGLVAALASYLEKGIASGAFRPVPDVRVAARFVVESIAWFAIHRHGDPGGKDFDDAIAREGSIDMVVAAVVATAESSPTAARSENTKKKGKDK